MDRVQQAEKRIMQSIATKQDEESKRLKLTDGIPLDRLTEICAAEKDGRCVILPCKVGDTVYVHKWAQKTDADGTVWDILDRKRATVSEKPFTLAMFFISKLGEGYWLTRESAEAALKGATPNE